jgi:hypothetical protein
MLRENDKSIVLSAALELANTQVLAQREDESGVDAQVRALVAFDAAILGLLVAAKNLVGILWVLPFVVTLASTLLCLALDRGSRRDLGPGASRFYVKYGGAAGAREQLLAELRRAIERNALRLRAKEEGVRLARRVLLAGLLLAGVSGIGDLFIRI